MCVVMTYTCSCVNIWSEHRMQPRLFFELPPCPGPPHVNKTNVISTEVKTTMTTTCFIKRLHPCYVPYITFAAVASWIARLSLFSIGPSFRIPWESRAHTMGIPWAYHGHPVGIPWASHGHSVTIPWTSNEHPVGIPWAFHGHPVGISWDISCGIVQDPVVHGTSRRHV